MSCSPLLAHSPSRLHFDNDIPSMITFNCILRRVAIAIVCTVLPAFAQVTDSAGESLLPEGFGIANQMKYSYDRELKREIFENWLNLDYRYKMFSAGFRFEIFQPNDPNPAVSRGKTRYADIAYKYITAGVGDIDAGGDITVGNFYALFGRGLVLKSYEDRNIRVDNNLLGVKVRGHYKDLSFTALTGRAENMSSQRTDILHAVDVEYKPVTWFRGGYSFASNQPDAAGAARTRLMSLRVQPSIGNADVYAEYGIKQNDDIRQYVFNNSESLAGRAFYASANFSYETFSVLGEYKYYDNFGFYSSDNSVSYNTPPALRKDYTYILLNRHPSTLKQDNEQGFQLEAFYGFGEHTEFNANYALTKSLKQGSLYQRIGGTQLAVQTQLKDAFGQVKHEWSADLLTIAALGYSEELDANTKNLTPILDVRFSLDETNTLHGIFEHQLTTVNTTREQYYDDVVTLEYLCAPDLTFSLVAEMQTREPLAGVTERTYWAFGQFGFKIGNHTDASVLAGSRQAGNICIGGVCRYEPEFKGIELKLATRF